MHRLGIVFLAFFFIASSSWGAIRIPKNLNESDREELTRILGWGTMNKILSDPYPLGGYSGVEVGVSIESVPIDELSKLGSPSAPQDRFTYPEISIAKGLYNSLDVFVNFIPFTESIGFSEYGGILRWGFYQATFIPASFSMVFYGNSANIQNQVLIQSFGADLIAGINMDDISIYFGGGKVRSNAQYVGASGSAESVTDSGYVESVTVEGFHSMFGAVFHIRPFFVAAQIDKYNDAVISAKIGVRF